MSEEKTSTEESKARTLQGSVESAKMDKTITVRVDRQLRHPLYKEYIRRSTRFHAHDANNECQAGDVVVIEECRPVSKLKSWRLVKVVSRADQDTTASGA